MSITAQQVLDYIDAHPIRLHNGDFASFLEMLHDVYTESNPINTDEIRDSFSGLRQILDLLPSEESDALFALVSDLCLKYEQTAFAHGITAGLYLHTELSTLS